MRLARTLLLGIAIVTAGCAASPRQRPLGTSKIETGPGTDRQARNFLEGNWALQSFEIYPMVGQAVPVNGTGQLTYDDFANLTVVIRVDESTSAMLAKNGIPTQRGVFTTTGRTAVDMQNKKLTYFIEGQPPLGAPSGPLALNRPRYWEVDGDVLTLTTKDADGNPMSVAKWKKVP